MLKSILLLFILPPINLVFLALSGLWVGRRWRRAGRAVSVASLLLLLLLATPAVAGLLLGPLEQDLPTTPPPDNPPQAIVVLGGEVMRTPSTPVGAISGHMTMDRLLMAAALHRRTGLPILVTGGSPETDVPAVAPLMDINLREALGVPVRWVEAKSLDTWENARFSTAILRDAGIGSVYVVTHPWHMKRALAAFARAGLSTTAAPTPLQHPVTLVPADFIPRPSAWETSYLALHEWVGRVWYALR
jgi:uncharacterized SAM-binding protein YcdF (DUF218 family)